MNNEPFDYTAEFDRLMILVCAAAEMPIDIDGIERELGRAEAIGPLLDPTKYQWGGGAKNLDDQRRVLQIAVPFIRGARKLREEVRASVPSKGI